MMRSEDERRKPLTLGQYVRSCRHAKGWTLATAEGKSGVDNTYWSKLERDEFQRPDPRYLSAIADALDAPLADVYALAGYTATDRLPSFRPYFRSKYALPPEAIEQLESYFTFLRHQYGIAESQPVFPPKPRRPQAPNPEPRPTGGPWDDPTLSTDGGRDRRAA